MDAYNSGSWDIFRSTTAAYDLMDIYYAQNNSYDQDSTHPFGGLTNQLISTSWVDSNTWVKISALSTTQIKFTIYRSTTKTFSNVYKVTFRFYT